MRVAIAMLLLCGCGTKPEFEYKVGCATFQSDAQLDEEALAINLDNAQGILADAKVMTREESCELLAKWPVYVRTDYQWNCRGELCNDGHFDVFSGFTVNNWAESLLHELLHAWEAKQLRRETVDHAGWEARGWTKLSDFYRIFARKTTR